MVKNQLFRISPDTDIINSLLKVFGLTSLNDTNFFTKETLKENNIIVQLNDMKMNTMAIFKKISYNKYAIENPPSGMFYTNFYSMGYLESSHSINFVTDIIISIK